MAKANPKTKKPKASGPKLKLDPNNARTHTPEGDAMIDASLDEIGPFRSIALDGDDVVRAGNGVYARAKARGLKVRIVDAKPDELIAVRRKDLKGLKAQRAALFDNRAGELSRWNGSVLAELPNKLKDGLWDADSFSQLLTDLGHKSETEPADAEPQIDRAAELQKKWKTKRGQLWALGEHRLLCGDSTVREDVERVMGDEKARMVFTDPPYNVAYSGRGQNTQREIENDSMGDDEFRQWLFSVCELMNEFTVPSASYYLCHGDTGNKMLPFVYVFEHCGWVRSATIIWAKNVASMGWQDYRSRHECISYGWKSGGEHYFTDDRSQTTVWEINRDAPLAYEHPTQKPIELCLKAITNSSKTGAILYEPFCWQWHNSYSLPKLGPQMPRRRN